MANEQVFFNGINGVTGQYIALPMSFSDLARLIEKEPVNQETAVKMKQSAIRLKQVAFGLPFGLDPSNVADVGWAIVFHANESEDIKKALAPLIEHRQKTIGDDKVKILDYRPGEQWLAWLERYGATPGDIDPDTVPYYILIVGDPTLIPYEFNYLMDVDYAVGRLSFDTADEYKSYAESVVTYETGNSTPNGKNAVIFGTNHMNVFPPDKATQISCDYLVKPLAGVSEQSEGKATKNIFDQVGFKKRSFIAQKATKLNLIATLRGNKKTKPPALLFTATHGIEFPKGDPNQIASQGALVCQEWPGPGAISKDFYFSASDLPSDAQIHGMISFHFACYGGGTPLSDNFPRNEGQAPNDLADKPFIAALPKQLLTHPNGGALAVIGHIERAWPNSIIGMDLLKTKEHIQPFVNTLGYLCTGKPVGYAVKDFNERTASLSTLLSQMLENVKAGDGDKVSNEYLASTWLGRNDARNYIVIGDPAVRLRVEKMN